MVPHYNYYPPAGQVVDQSDSRLSWNGKSWMLSGKPFAVPSTHRLIGSPNGPLRGWYYDWGKHAWMEPSPTDPGGRPPAQPPQKQPPAPPPPQKPPAQPPSKPPQQPPTHGSEKEECHVMEKKPNTVLEDLVKHPVAPVLGGLLVLAGYVANEPDPPVIPDDLPEPVAKQWQMVYTQNIQRFERRMSMYRDLGMVLLGYSGTRSIVDVLGGLHHEHRMLAEKK